VILAVCFAIGVVHAHLGSETQPTLRQAIAAAGVPVATARMRDLDSVITSWSSGCDRDDYLVAYYVPSSRSDKALSGPLELAEYDAEARRWAVGHIDAAPRPNDGFWRKSDRRSLSLGSVLGVEFAGPYVYTELHYSPSATMTVRFSRDLKPVGSFYGWSLGRLANGSIVYQNSMVHFSPTHAAHLSLYVPATNSSIALFPRQPYGPIRSAHLKALAAAYASAGDSWMRENNYPPDPDEGDADIAARYVNGTTGAAAFAIHYSLSDQSFPSLPPSKFLDVTAIYVYRGLSDPPNVQWKELVAPAGLHITDALLASYTTADGLKRVFND